MRLWIVVFALVACAVVSQATAAPRPPEPRLDRTFGRAGAVALRVPSTVNPARSFIPDWELIDAVADRSGRAYVLWSGLGAASKVLAAYDAEGRLDRTFGDDGTVALGALGGFDVALDSEGRILVLGFPRGADQNSPGALVLRVLPEGRLDPAFGFSGVQRETSQGFYPWDILSDGSGGVLVLATLGRAPRLWVVFRLGPDGMLDRTYGDDGVASVPRMGEGGLRAHTVDATGRFVAVDAINEVLPPQIALVGLDASGRPDSALGEQGTRLLDFGPRDAGVSDIGVDAIGRYVVLGVRDQQQAPFIARYLSDGTPDAGWSASANGVRDLLTDGKFSGTILDTLTIGGTSYYADGTRYDNDHPRRRDRGDSVVVRVDEGSEQVWTSPGRRFKFGLQALAARDGTLLTLGHYRSRRHPRRVIDSLVRLRFD